MGPNYNLDLRKLHLTQKWILSDGKLQKNVWIITIEVLYTVFIRLVRLYIRQLNYKAFWRWHVYKFNVSAMQWLNCSLMSWWWTDFSVWLNLESFLWRHCPYHPNCFNIKGKMYLLIKTKHPKHCTKEGKRRSRLSGLMRLSSKDLLCVRLALTFHFAQEPSASFFTFLQLR